MPHRTRTALAALALLAAACSRGTAPGDGAPFITGPVVAVLEDGRIQVADGSDSTRCGAVAGLGRSTRVLARDGGPRARTAIAAGQRVSVWITGTVRESCPAQVDARVVVIEAAGR